MLYTTFCKIGNAVGSGCFKSPKVELTAIVNKIKPLNKFSFGLKKAVIDIAMNFAGSIVFKQESMAPYSPNTANILYAVVSELPVIVLSKPVIVLTGTPSYANTAVLYVWRQVSTLSSVLHTEE